MTPKTQENGLIGHIVALTWQKRIQKKDSNDIYLEDLCYNAQQAVEKAIKAVFIKYGIDFPFTHDIAELLSL